MKEGMVTELAIKYPNNFSDTGYLTIKVSVCCQHFKSTITAASLCTGVSKTKPTTWPSAAQ